MIKLVLEKAEEPETKLPTLAGSLKKQESFRKNIYFCFIDYAKAFDCVDHNKLWKTLKEMRIPDHVTCLLRNLYAGREATVRTRHGKTDWSQIGKGVCQGCILTSCLFNLYAKHIMRNKLESRFPGEISGQVYRWYHPYDRKWRRTKEPLDENERGKSKVGLKLKIQKTKIMACGPTTSWQIDGETVETVADFIYLGSKITVDGDCRHEIKRCLLLGSKVIANLDSILKSRDSTLPTKVHHSVLWSFQ